MSTEIYAVLSLGMRYVFTALGALIVLRAFLWLRRDRREKHERPWMAGRLLIPTVPFRELYFLESAKRFQSELQTPCIYVGGIQSRDNCEQVLQAGFPLMQMAHTLIKDPDFVKHMQADVHYHAGCGRSNYCVGRMYTLDMKCHQCVLRDNPEQLPQKLQREIEQLEHEAGTIR